MSYNKCIFKGNLLNKKMDKTNSGNDILFFTLETWDDKHDKKEYLDCVAYSSLAKVIDRDFSEKNEILIETKAHTYNKESVKRTSFVVETFSYVGANKR